MNPAAAPTRPAARLAADVAKALTLSDPAKALLTPALTPRQYFDILHAVPLSEDAVRFLAAALPRREAVWWACLCTRQTLGNPAPDAAAKAVAAAEKRVKDPSEPNRRNAGAAAELAGYG